MKCKIAISIEYYCVCEFLIVLLLVTTGIRGDDETATTTTTTTRRSIEESGQTTTVKIILPSDPPQTTKNTPNLQSLDMAQSVLKNLGPLRGLAHGVKSGDVIVYNDNRILIQNFYFDGNAPEAHFSVGQGEISKGTFVPFEDGTEEGLKAFNGQDIVLKLPSNITFDSIDWISVWCVFYDQNLGYVLTKQKMPQIRNYPPQVFHLDGEVKSNPIVLIDKKTIFIPNIRYKGGHADAHFWVGNGSEPNKDGVLVLDENRSSDNIHAYSGVNIELKLPDGLSVDDVEYFGVYSRGEDLSLGYVPLDTKRMDVPEVASQLDDGVIVMRVPKCCAINWVLFVDGCKETTEYFNFAPSVNVSDHNETHLNTDPLDPAVLDFQPYYFSPNCRSGKKYPLDASIENFSLLKNGSLIVKGAGITGILSQGDFCIDYINANEDALILVCAPEVKLNKAIFDAYLALIIISTICFIAVFITYYFILTWDDIHKKCFSAYAFSMSITFLMLIIIQVAYVECTGCTVVAFLFQIAMISSFTWIAILCFDVYVMVRYFEDNMKVGARMKWYWAIGFGVPILSLIISFAKNMTPDVPNSFFKPQYGNNKCYFDADDQRRIFFYLPIFFSILVSAVFMGMTKWKIVQNDRLTNYFWLERGRNYKYMFRRYLLVWVTMLLWLIEAFLQIYYTSTALLMAIDLLEATQGIIILLMFVVNSNAKEQIQENIRKQKKRKRSARREPIAEENFMLT